MIADATGAAWFEIVPENSYPKDSYDECIEIAKWELQQNVRPAVKGDEMQSCILIKVYIAHYNKTPRQEGESCRGDGWD